MTNVSKYVVVLGVIAIALTGFGFATDSHANTVSCAEGILSVGEDNGETVLSWKDSATHTYGLEYTHNLLDDPVVWSAVLATPSVENGCNVVREAESNPAKFYQLVAEEIPSGGSEEEHPLSISCDANTPVLSISNIDGVITLAWSLNFDNYKLQETESLLDDPVRWTDSNLPIDLVNGCFVAMDTASGSQKFYEISMIDMPEDEGSEDNGSQNGGNTGNNNGGDGDGSGQTHNITPECSVNPVLTVADNGVNILVAWHKNLTDYTLQYSNNLIDDPIVWNDYTGEIEVMDNCNVARFDKTANRFYELREVVAEPAPVETPISCVDHTPILTILNDGNETTLSWSTNFPNYSLEYTNNLIDDPVVWTELNATKSEEDGCYVVRQETTTPNKFYKISEVVEDNGGNDDNGDDNGGNNNGGSNNGGSNNGGGSTGGSTGGGGIINTSDIQFTNVTATIRDNSFVIASWNTNNNAQAYVVYGRTSIPNVSVADIATNFGYEYSSDKNDLFIRFHNFVISHLINGTTYYLRPVGINDRGEVYIGPEISFVFEGVSGSEPIVGDSGTCEFLTSSLRFGRDNDPTQVEKLQRFLKDVERFDVDVNGIFDEKTLQAAKDFQVRYAADILEPWGRTTATGYVHITTKKKMNEINCNTSIDFTGEELSTISRIRALVNGIRDIIVPDRNTGNEVEIPVENVELDDIIGIEDGQDEEVVDLEGDEEVESESRLRNFGSAILGIPRSIGNFFKSLF